MPRKKLEEKVESDETVAVELPKEPKVCGHINKHYIGPNGKPFDLACTLNPGHSGDHSAPCERNVPTPVSNEKGITIKTEWHIEQTVAHWSDAAGRRVEDIQSEVVVEMTGYQKDLVMDVLKRNPTMDVDTAVAKAKMQDNWNIQKPRQ